MSNEENGNNLCSYRTRSESNGDSGSGILPSIRKPTKAYKTNFIDEIKS